MPLKIVSWNVNGLRAVLKKGFLDYLADTQPDILCLQETKAMQEQVDDVFPPEYTLFWNSAEKKGYSGTVILTRPSPLTTSCGIGIEEHDHEGRVLTLEYEDFFLVNVYTPNSQNELRRLDYRTQAWDVAFLEYVRGLEVRKPVIFCGDLNVAHREIDLARPKANRRNAGFTDEERAGFDRIVEAGYIDAFRELHPEESGQYTWWSFRANARARNVGWRIDYVCLSSQLRPRLLDAFIQPEVTGSDHCPTGIVLAPA